MAVTALAAVALGTAGCQSSKSAAVAPPAAAVGTGATPTDSAALGAPTLPPRPGASLTPGNPAGSGAHTTGVRPGSTVAPNPSHPTTLHPGTWTPPTNPVPPSFSNWPAPCSGLLPPKPVPGQEFYRIPMGPQFLLGGDFDLPQPCFSFANGYPDLKNWVVQVVVVDTKLNVRRALTLHRTDPPVVVGRFSVRLGPTTRAGQTFDVIVDWA